MPTSIYSKRLILQLFQQLCLLEIVLRFATYFATAMASSSNTRRAMQGLHLGNTRPSIPVPQAIVNRVANANRYIIHRVPVIPRRQNVRTILSVLPRTWSLEGIVHGREAPNNQFQFIFPAEDLMLNVLQNGPWSFHDRMLVLQRWSLNFNHDLLNYIPFWVQIRGIPFHLLGREIFDLVGNELGQILEVDPSMEGTVQLSFVRLRINWCIHNPLIFQLNFQFTPGQDSLVQFRYERLRRYCQVCGLITHDTGDDLRNWVVMSTKLG